MLATTSWGWISTVCLHWRDSQTSFSNISVFNFKELSWNLPAMKLLLFKHNGYYWHTVIIIKWYNKYFYLFLVEIIIQYALCAFEYFNSCLGLWVTNPKFMFQLQFEAYISLVNEEEILLKRPFLTKFNLVILCNYIYSIYIYLP